MTRLRDHTWQESFTSSQDNLLEGFYRPALQEAIRYWRITGYFSSRSLLQVLDGVEQLVLASPDGRGHGQMRLITGFFMRRADLQALGSSQTPEQLLEQQLCHQFPFRSVKPGDGSAADLCAELLAWLVHQGHLEIRVGLPVHEGQISTDGAIFHAKEGVIEDSTGDRLAFTGSINETPNGWSTNYETFDVFCSWRGEERRVDAKERHFLRLWQNEDPGVRTFSLPEAFRQQLAIYAPAEGVKTSQKKPKGWGPAHKFRVVLETPGSMPPNSALAQALTKAMLPINQGAQFADPGWGIWSLCHKGWPALCRAG
ncbi:MAG: hypothetical protein ACK5QQ_14265 [Cyanobacteriota bacterium]